MSTVDPSVLSSYNFSQESNLGPRSQRGRAIGYLANSYLKGAIILANFIVMILLSKVNESTV
jgi:hypothetical protein